MPRWFLTLILVLWELERFPAAMIVSRAVPAHQPEILHQALGQCQTSSGQRGTPSGQKPKFNSRSNSRKQS